MEMDGQGSKQPQSMLGAATASVIWPTTSASTISAAASTAFWVDPVEGVHCVFLTQLLPSSVYVSLRWDLRTLVNQALVD